MVWVKVLSSKRVSLGWRMVVPALVLFGDGATFRALARAFPAYERRKPVAASPRRRRPPVFPTAAGAGVISD
ncbi:MAG: hypothetical protein JNM13_01805 [Hyphomicrobiaceae bacterium]|nr:hypothetical protein [Hyphomicrobiaceae bacterium]